MVAFPGDSGHSHVGVRLEMTSREYLCYLWGDSHVGFPPAQGFRDSLSGDTRFSSWRREASLPGPGSLPEDAQESATVRGEV